MLSSAAAACSSVSCVRLVLLSCHFPCSFCALPLVCAGLTSFWQSLRYLQQLAIVIVSTIFTTPCARRSTTRSTLVCQVCCSCCFITVVLARYSQLGCGNFSNVVYFLAFFFGAPVLKTKIAQWSFCSYQIFFWQFSCAARRLLLFLFSASSARIGLCVFYLICNPPRLGLAVLYVLVCTNFGRLRYCCCCCWHVIALYNAFHSL